MHKFIANLTSTQKVILAITSFFTLMLLSAWIATGGIIHPFSGFTLWSTANIGEAGVEMLKKYNEDKESSDAAYRLYLGTSSTTDLISTTAVK